MQPIERVQAAFAKAPTDRVPIHHIGFSSEIASVLLGREAYVGGGIQRWREVKALWQGPDAHAEFIERSFQDAIAIARLTDQDILRPDYWRYHVRPTKKLDENTYLFGQGAEENWRVLRYDPESEQAIIADYVPRAATTLEELERQVAAQEKGVRDYAPSAEDFATPIRAQQLYSRQYVVRVGAGAVGIPTENLWLEAAALRPDLVERHLDIQAERAARQIPFLARQGFRYIWGGGDFAGNDGPMYSPRVFHNLVLPRLRRIVEMCHQAGVQYLFASDGNLWSVADDLFGRSGVDGYFEIDLLAGMELRRLRERFLNMTLVGNISSHTVHRSTRAEVIAQTRACLEEAKQLRGVIVGVSNYFVPGTPVGNVEAVLETIREHR
jgi:hypothetical protein